MTGRDEPLENGAENEPKKPEVVVVQAAVITPKVTEETVKKAGQILQKYKSGKKSLESRITENEQYWKMKQWDSVPGKKQNTPSTSWLWNSVVAKHADMMDAYPEAGFMARAKDDEQEAKLLTDIVPVILEQNDFLTTYSDCAWYKLKQGASCYGVFWDKSKHGGMGDITIRKVDLINLFWEPGITDIQQSRHLFSVELRDNELLEQHYPELKGRLGPPSINVMKYLYDDNVDTSDKSVVVDWYYHTEYNGRRLLHYCKYVNDVVLFASENEPENYPNGWYGHGCYPFVIDSLFDVEGSVCGYGLIDVGKQTQIQIDLLSDAIIKNARISSQPRFFYREDGSVNLDDFRNMDNDFVKVQGNLGEDSIRQINVEATSGNCITILQNKIDELKETSGNRDVNNGVIQHGVTAASAIAALQEAAGKTSRDMITTTYNAFKLVIFQVVELIREFYDVGRTFRITGEDGGVDYMTFDNSGLKPQAQGWAFGVDLGYRVPQFDIDVSPQKANPYNKMSQNELALQFFQLRFFDPQMADQALACLDMMDFQTKKAVETKIRENQAMMMQMQMPAPGPEGPPAPQGGGEPVSMPSAQDANPAEAPHMLASRSQTQSATQPR